MRNDSANEFFGIGNNGAIVVMVGIMTPSGGEIRGVLEVVAIAETPSSVLTRCLVTSLRSPRDPFGSPAVDSGSGFLGVIGCPGLDWPFFCGPKQNF